jgi:ribonuclease VapC
MMVIDTSTLLAVALHEAEAERFLEVMDETEMRLISAASVVEAGIVIESRRGPAAGDALDDLIVLLSLEIEPVTAAQASIARRAWRTYGKGRHPAGLNFGDCFAYALAKVLGQFPRSRGVAS